MKEAFYQVPGFRWFGVQIPEVTTIVGKYTIEMKNKKTSVLKLDGGVVHEFEETEEKMPNAKAYAWRHYNEQLGKWFTRLDGRFLQGLP
jgi:hypothetical protein